MRSHKCRVLLVDDHERIREALRALLIAYDDVQIVGEARNGEEAIEQVASCQPDVILMDTTMLTMNALGAKIHHCAKKL